jgi:hypothetical protein
MCTITKYNIFFLYLNLVVCSQGGDEGVFWISYTDVLKFFDCIDICKVRRALTSRTIACFILHILLFSVIILEGSVI